MIRLATIVGARPQFIKAAALSATLIEEFSGEIDEQIIHTGQHFDQNMSQAFFSQLNIPAPKFILETRSGSHGASTGMMMGDIDACLEEMKPDLVLVFGDTNSTLAGALSAVKMQIPVAHVEAGMRSKNWRMPEEINRVATDHLAAINFAPSKAALDQLGVEALGPRSVLTGDIMFDAVKRFASASFEPSPLVSSVPDRFALVTLHRQENTSVPEKLSAVLDDLVELSKHIEVVLPAHPRLLQAVDRAGLLDLASEKLRLVEPVSFLDMLALTKAASVVITDSGGLQKEAFYLGVPCVTVRNETEWVETVELGWNRLVSPDARSLAKVALGAIGKRGDAGSPYGDGNTANRIGESILLGSWKQFF
jgi:UDP-GlcNAc3NAcA epimerase